VENKKRYMLFVLVILLMLSFSPSKGVCGEDAGPDYLEEEQYLSIPDPLEPLNRVVFEFNDRLYFWVLKPLARGYSTVVPEDFRYAMGSFFHNITTPVRVVNSILQGRLRKAGVETLRFLLNTTGGVFGLNDFAGKDLGLKPPDDEDMGQTLGTYGMGHGFYIVWPVLGPSSLRDTIGIAGDGFLNPINYLAFKEAVLVRTVEFTNKTSLHIGEYEELKASAIDPYVSMQDAYLQYRNSELKK